MAGVIEVTADTFAHEVIEHPKPVLVDFWGQWCGPCRMLAPMLEEIAGRHQDSLKVVKLDIDECGAIADKYEVQSVPTLLVFVGGSVVKIILGAKPKSILLRELSDYV
jgi:thioredoxin 1